MAVGHAHRADMVALGEEQLQRHPPVFAQPFAVGLDVHALATLVVQAGSSLAIPGHFHQAQPAGAHIINAVQMAERRNFDARLRRGVQDRRAFLGADLLSVNR
jgi:hypothetical protein